MSVTLQAIMHLSTANFTAPLQRAQSQLQSFVGQLAPLSTSIATAFSVGAVIDFARRIINTGDEIANLSARLGISSDSLQRLGFAASQSGSSMQSLTGGIQHLIRSIADARGGSEETTSAFNRLGISAEMIQQASPEEMFLAIADGLARSENKTQAMADVFQVLGRGAGDLIPLLREGRAEIERLGSSAPIISAESIQSIKDANDEFERLSLDLKSSFAPAVAGVASVLSDTVKGFKAIGAAIGAWSIAPEVGWENAMVGFNEQINEIAGKPAKPFKSTTESAMAAVVALEKLNRELQPIRDRISSLDQQISLFDATPGQRIDALDEKLASLRGQQNVVGNKESKEFLELEEKIKRALLERLELQKQINSQDTRLEQHAEDVVDELTTPLNQREQRQRGSPDEFQRVGLFIGGGARPELDLQRRTAAATEKALPILEKIADTEDPNFGNI